MEILKSTKFKLPILYFIIDRKEIKELPIGVPFIYGSEKDKPYIIRLLEYEVLYQKALSTGMPFNFKKILEDEGYDLYEFGHSPTVYIDYADSELLENYEKGSDWDIDDMESLDEGGPIFKEYIRDCTAYVDTQKLKDLNVFPIWLDKIEKAVETNIHNFAVFNPYMYNKKLDGMYGAMELTSPDKNLIIVDISSSIPKAVSTTTLLMAKSMAETFYADILVTGKISKLYYYEEIFMMDVEKIYKEIGMSNEQYYFKKIVTGEKRRYNTVIAFGDNNHPGTRWGRKDKIISDEEGKRICQWEIKKLISFHTDNNIELAGYARWFDVPESNIEKIANWVKYLQ